MKMKHLMDMHRFFFWALIMALWTGMPGCGYKLAGGGALPAGIHTVCISMFENRSSETGIENQLVSDLIYEFTRNGQKVTTKPEKAQGILSGVVKSVSVSSVSYSSEETTLESRVTVVADVVLRNADGEEIWSADGIAQKQAYATDRDDKQADDKKRKDALALVSRRFAETIYGRLTENF